MPVTSIELNDNEVRAACAHWVAAGCPPADPRGVYLHVTPGSNDPREPSRPTVSATIKVTK